MTVIHHYSLDPHFNLAAEQYLLEGSGDVFLIWRNTRSVIIGKNQNAFGEVNVDFTGKNNIKVARRLTGGGAVFHDEGNINYTFITDDSGEGIDFARFTEPVCEALASFGISATLNGRNDLTVGEYKISGNAQCVYDTADGRKRLLHHGTILFSADISEMAGALRVNEEKLKSKGIKSVPSRVKNICDMAEYKGPESPEKFADALVKFAEVRFGEKSRDLTENEKAEISKIRDGKFALWDWNFGASPEYKSTAKRRFPYGTVEISYDSLHGIIEKITVSGDFFGVENVSELEKNLIGARLLKDDIIKRLENIDKYISGAAPEEIADMIAGNSDEF